MSILIEKQLALHAWLEQAIPACTEDYAATLTCPRCGDRIRLPIIARQQDIDAMTEIIGLAEKYIEDKGIMAKMLSHLLSQIVIARAKK